MIDHVETLRELAAAYEHEVALHQRGGPLWAHWEKRATAIHAVLEQNERLISERNAIYEEMQKERKENERLRVMVDRLSGTAEHFQEISRLKARIEAALEEHLTRCLLCREGWNCPTEKALRGEEPNEAE